MPEEPSTEIYEKIAHRIAHSKESPIHTARAKMFLFQEKRDPPTVSERALYLPFTAQFPQQDAGNQQRGGVQNGKNEQSALIGG